MYVIGLTGGIGSGKSTVAATFANLGAGVIDTDAISREITQPGLPATKAIEKHFGNQVINPDGTLDRNAIKQHIFNDPDERNWLEELLHPLIKAELKRQIDELETPYCIAVIPLLFEVEFYESINRILVIDVTEETQIERTMKRDGVSREVVIKILQAQAKRKDRIARAHDIIINDGSTEDVIAQVEQLHHKYLKLAASDKKHI